MTLRTVPFHIIKLVHVFELDHENTGLCHNFNNKDTDQLLCSPISTFIFHRLYSIIAILNISKLT